MIEVRPALEADLGALLAIYNEVVLNTTASYDETPRSEAAQAEWHARKRQGGFPVLVAAEGPEVLGFSSYGPFRAWHGYRFTVESSIYIRTDSRGRGIGGRLLPPLLEAARGQGLHAVVAGIDAANEASLRLHARHGFERVAHFPEVGFKFGRWLDLVFMQRLLDR